MSTAAPKPARWPAGLAWLVILSLASFMVYRNSQVSRTPDNNEIAVNDIRIRLVGEELIGLKSIGSLAGPAQVSQVTKSQQGVMRQLEQSARSPEDRLHVAIIGGEIFGKEQALTRLDALARDPLPAELSDDIAALRLVYASDGGALDPPSRDRLIRRHGYFAQLALAFGVRANVEPRKSMEAGALRATLVLGLATFALGLILVAAFGFFVAAIALKVKGRLTRMYVSDASASTAFLEVFALYFLLFIPVLGSLRRYFGLSNLQWEWLAWLILPAVMSWLAWRGIPLQEQRRALGWHTGRGVFREIGAGIAGYLAGIVVLIIGFALTYLLMKRTGISPEHPLIHMLEGDRWHVLGLYALVTVFAPVLEETMFRGALFHHLRRRWGWGASALIVAFIFAVIHPQGWVAVPVLGSIAIVLAALREWRGSLIAPMVAHALNNFIVLTLALSVLG